VLTLYEARVAGNLDDIPLIVLSEDPAKNVRTFLPAFEQGQQDLMHSSEDGRTHFAPAPPNGMTARK
jgi:hypothetical protein